MAKEIRWSPEFVEKFEQIIEYLKENWGDREIENFIEETYRVISFISEYPRMFRKTNLKNVHEAMVTSHNLVIYEIHSSHITLVTYWDTRQNPSQRKIRGI